LTQLSIELRAKKLEFLLLHPNQLNVRYAFALCNALLP